MLQNAVGCSTTMLIAGRVAPSGINCAPMTLAAGAYQLCQPLPQPPLCQPLPQPPLCQPLPQPPLCQPFPQPPLCQPQPPLRQPLPHQASCCSGSTATNGSPSLAYCCRASVTESRIDCRRSATSPGFFGVAPASGD